MTSCLTAATSEASRCITGARRLELHRDRLENHCTAEPVIMARGCCTAEPAIAARDCCTIEPKIAACGCCTVEPAIMAPNYTAESSYWEPHCDKGRLFVAC